MEKQNLSSLSSGFNPFSPHSKSRDSVILIDKRYYIKSLKQRREDYNIYKGIDTLKAKWVHIYAKHIDCLLPFSSKLKQSSRNTLAPKVLWAGEQTIDKVSYYFEVHQKYGPSLKSMFEVVHTHLNDKQLLHLLFELIKLVQKINNAKYVYGELNVNNIIFDANPKKNDLYLLNCFELRKKNQEVKISPSKYCSRGAHLGRSLTIKDDLQSICYILIDLYTQGNFLRDQTSEQYEEEKLSLKIESFGPQLPRIFIDFYSYVINLNYNDEINFFHWKNYLTRILSAQTFAQPYGWMIIKERDFLCAPTDLEELEMNLDNEIGEEKWEWEDHKMEKVTRRVVIRKIGSNI